ncbi:MAG: hypothetical protein LBK52_07735 [Deltaproteobacteria bacterium]|jgi:hypothetical protein|nr:hypothetical protein [Deltaproteobacteria bacterium]
MNKNLKRLYDSDPGFTEFADRFDLSVADSETIAAYERWNFQQSFIDQELRLREEEGLDKGMDKGHGFGHRQGHGLGHRQGHRQGHGRGLVKKCSVGLSKEQ